MQLPNNLFTRYLIISIITPTETHWYESYVSQMHDRAHTAACSLPRVSFRLWTFPAIYGMYLSHQGHSLLSSPPQIGI